MVSGSNFEDITWGKERISKEKLNRMTENDRWLYEHMIKGHVNVYGLQRETGLEIRAGYVRGLVSEAGAFFVDHYYTKPFLPGSRPVVVCSLASAGPMKIILGTRGLDNRAIPDHLGFRVHFQQFRDPGGPTKFAAEQFASYIAISGSS